MEEVVDEVVADDGGVGAEFFDAAAFYSLPRATRAKLLAAWKEHGNGQPIVEQYVGRIEDVLWAAKEYALTRAVLDVAKARRDRRVRLDERLRDLFHRAPEEPTKQVGRVRKPEEDA